MPKTLKEKCKFVKGAKNAAIYDLANKKVYVLNSVGKSFVEDFVIDPTRLNPQGVEYIEKLENLGLIEENDSIRNIENEQPTCPDCHLHYVWLELTQHCNLRCVHCYGQFGSPINESSNTKAMTTEDWKRVIREIKEAGCTAIQLIGGEPLCFSNFKEILTYAHAIGMERIDIFTNGTLINESFLQLVKETRASVRVSLYGHDAHTHESVTGVKGSFQKTVTALKLLKEQDVPTTVAVIIMKANQSYIEEIKTFIESLGHVFSGYDTIRQVAGKVNNDNCITDAEILESRYHTSANFFTSEEQYAHNLHWNNCWSGKLAITDSGDLLPCIFARDTVIGNVSKESLSEGLDKALPYWSMTLDQVDGCKDCEYRYACYNCRPLAMSIGGAVDSKEPRCCYDPYEGIWRDIEECTKELGAALKTIVNFTTIMG